MDDKLKLGFPETKIYLIFILMLSFIIGYYDRFISILALGLSLYLLYYNAVVTKNKNSKLLIELKNLSLEMDEASKQTMLDFPVALCIVDAHGNIKWHNKMLTSLFNRENMIEKNITMYLKDYDFSSLIPQDNQESKLFSDFPISGKYYDIQTINLTKNTKRSSKYAIYFFDISNEKDLLLQYNSIKPCILQLQIDSYDEVINSTSDEFKSILSADIERRLKLWVDKFQGILVRISDERYVAILTQPNLSKMEEDKFSILDEVRDVELSNSIPVTLSIGVSSFDNNLQETNKNAISSLEMATSRGGDQAVYKKDEKTLFYGGKSKAVEKKTRVRARIVGHALRDLIQNSSNVLVMGHTNPDMDAIGSAIGVCNICKILGIKANIILENSNPSIGIMYQSIREDENYKDIFISHEQSKKLLTNNTLLVVVDTHRPSFTEYPKALENAKKIVFIDHHRRGVEYIENAVLSYHETYASSASEMVTELVQYTKDYATLDSIVATCLLAGITLDTKNFTKKAGVRTFEAAAYLRKNNADSVEVKKFFQGDYEGFLIKARSIKNASIYREHIALTVCDENLDSPNLIAAQIADELLNIQGVKASFVVASGKDNKAYISARSFEDINVQVIMEKLGGGGHIDTAGAQIEYTDLEEAINLIKKSIDEYFDDDKEDEEKIKTERILS